MFPNHNLNTKLKPYAIICSDKFKNFFKSVINPLPVIRET